MTITICGIKHEVIEVEDHFDTDTHFGQIDYGKAVIKINKHLNEEIKTETLCHEILHGILVHIGRDDLAMDEQFVTAIGNAINQTFEIKDGEQDD